MTQNEDFKKLVSLIKDIKFTMLTTVAEDGSLHSRPMAVQKIDDSFDGTLWFFSKKDSFKNGSIENEQHVNLAFAHPEKQHYVSVSGRATISYDREKMNELWHPLLKAWFPEGLEDPEISLIGVQVESAELWDSPPSKVVQLVGLLKSTIAGKPYDGRDHTRHIDLRNQQ
jgi:general stress protein 26